MTMKDIVLGVVGLAALLIFTLIYGPFFVVRDLYRRANAQKD